MSDDIEKNYNSNKNPEVKNQIKYFNEEDDEEENISENKDKFEADNLDDEKIISQLISKNGNKINLSGKDLSTVNSQILLNNLYKKYPNATEIDINNCNLEKFPKIFLNFKKLISFDLRNNNFIDFESLSEDLSNYPNLTDLKIDLTDQNQVLMILSQIPKLIFLNGKSTKDAITIVDVDEKDIEDISLQNDLQIYNDIVNKINEKESDQIFVTNFQNKLYDEAEKVKICLNNNVPNYIYANVVIQSQFELEKYLADKFLSFLDENNKNIGNILFDSIFKSGERLVNLMNNLYPKIEEKTDGLRTQLEEAWKSAEDVGDFENKFNEMKKLKDIGAGENEILKLKLNKLENENKIILINY